MPIEPLELGEEPAVEGEAIENTHRVVGIGGRDQAVAGVLNGFEVPGCDVAGDPGDGEVLGLTHLCTATASRRIWANRGAVTCSE